MKLQRFLISGEANSRMPEEMMSSESSYLDGSLVLEIIMEEIFC